MTQWSEDLSACSLDEVIRTQTENRLWRKELRVGTKALIDSRLAKSITHEEYLATRKQAAEEAAECDRRATKLSDEIAGRHGTLPMRSA